MSTLEQSAPQAPVEEESLPTFNNGITPLGQPPLPVLTEPVPRAEIDPSVAPVFTVEYRSPVEAVAGVGGIAGVAAEEE